MRPGFERRRAPVSKLLFTALCAIVMANAIVTPLLWVKIQRSRQESVRQSCVELNDRHDRTLAAYDRILLDRVSGGPVDRKLPPAEVTHRLLAGIERLPRDRRIQIEQARVSIAFVIQALAPRRDCAERVQQLT